MALAGRDEGFVYPIKIEAPPNGLLAGAGSSYIGE
jgi:hypothetical protein